MFLSNQFLPEQQHTLDAETRRTENQCVILIYAVQCKKKKAG
jgi:hypothetical protein